MLETRAFNEKAFREILAAPPRNEALVADNPRVAYLFEYLDFLKTKTIVIENDYIDRNFLEDHAAYYVRCHVDYGRKCRRLHFFSKAFTNNELEKAVLGATENLKDTLGEYHGFLVAKPLYQSFIGRTCLKTYPVSKEGGERHYDALEKQRVNLLGHSLEVDSMPFQEQDAVVAACATTAIWSALQVVGATYDRYRPTPAEITAEAAAHPSVFGRNLPSSGLILPQMMQAIVQYGFEPEVRDLKEPTDYMRTRNLSRTRYLAELTMAYGHAGLPLIIGHKLACSKYRCTWNGGFHAATIAGYSLKGPGKRPLSTHVDEFYAHDDQAGPFSKFVIKDGQLLRTKFPHKEHPGDVAATPTIVIIPTYPKIRITYEQARSQSERVSKWLHPATKN